MGDCEQASLLLYQELESTVDSMKPMFLKRSPGEGGKPTKGACSIYLFWVSQVLLADHSATSYNFKIKIY